MKKIVIGLLIGFGFFSNSVFAGDIAAGQAKSMTCAACHGANGVAMIPGYPNLKGQNEQYLVTTLKAYKTKQRIDGLAAVMYAQTASLSDQDIENLAAYYASLK